MEGVDFNSTLEHDEVLCDIENGLRTTLFFLFFRLIVSTVFGKRLKLVIIVTFVTIGYKCYI